MEEEYPLERLEQPMTVEEKKARLSELQREIRTAKLGAEQEIRQILHELYPDAPKPSFEFVDYAHNLIVTNNLDIRSAVILALDHVGKDEDWYDATQYKAVRGLGAAVENHKRKVGHKRLVKNGGLDNKKLKKAKHTADYLKQLGSAKSIADRLDRLEEQTIKNDIEIRRVNLRHSITTWAMRNGIKDIPDFSKDRKLARSLVLYLTNMDVTPQDISDCTSIPLSTIYRWIAKNN